MLEELETALRDMLRPFEGERLMEAVKVEHVEQLNPLHYQEACSRFWAELAPFADPDKKVVLATLVSFAEQRNALMHFRLKDKAAMDADLRRFGLLQQLIRSTTKKRTRPPDAG